jgi:hypothetical protein
MSQIAFQRLYQQRISHPTFDNPADAVAWLGAVQAQDYLASLWALGLRMPGATDTLIEKAIADRSILRTWPMRGTVHFVPAADAGWMLKLLAPRVMRRYASTYQKAGLDETIFARSRDIFIKALEGGKQLKRSELYDLLEADGIDTSETRGLFISGYLAQEGLICFAPRQGKLPTFALLNEWVPNPRNLEGDEALAEFARRYFLSHGPATIQDFMWWTGLTVPEAKAGIEGAKAALVQETIDGQIYWFSPSISFEANPSPDVYLLPAYDEYLVGYKDRSAVLATRHGQIGMRKNPVFSNIIVLDGQVVGTWDRSVKKDSVLIKPELAVSLNPAQQDAFIEAVTRYGNFLGLTATLPDNWAEATQ